MTFNIIMFSLYFVEQLNMLKEGFCKVFVEECQGENSTKKPESKNRGEGLQQTHN